MSLMAMTRQATLNWIKLGSGFWRIWAATTVSSLGDGVRYTAIPLLAATLTRDPVLVSLVTTAEYLPVLLFSLASGVLADRYDRREIMWRSNLVRTLITALFAASVALEIATLSILTAVVFALGATSVLFGTASQSLIPEVVRREELPRANSSLAVGVGVSEQFLAPALGALLFVVAYWLPFSFDALTFAVASVLIFSLRGTRGTQLPTGARPGIRKEVAEGLQWLWRNRTLRSLCIMAAAFSFFSKATLATEILYVLQVLQLSQTEFGVLLTAIAVGSVLGSLAVPTLTDRLGKRAALVVSVTCAVIACVGLGLTSSVFFAVPMFALFGVSMTLWSVVAVSFRQALVPRDILGRVNSAYRFLSGSTAPLGALFGGFLAQQFGLRAPYLVGALVLTIIASVTLSQVSDETLAGPG